LATIINLFRGRGSGKDLFHALLRPHIEVMYRMAYRWTQSQADAEDLVQDILVRLALRVDEMQQVDILRPWLIKILYRRYVDLYRRQKNSPVEFEHDDWQPDEAEVGSRIERAADSRDDIRQLDMQRTLLVAMGELEQNQRDVILLHDMEGYTALEVADILDINVGTVKSRLHRARQKLKNFLTDGPF